MGVERLGTAEEVRRSLTESQLKVIAKVYESAYNEVQKELNRGIKSSQALNVLSQDIKQNYTKVYEEITAEIVSSMRTVVETVADDKREKLRERGYHEEDVKTAFIHVPDRVVRSIAAGSVYNEGWTLSKAIWGESRKIQKDLTQIIAEGVAAGKDTAEIAKLLEQYVQPRAKKRSRVIEFQKYLRDSQGLLIRDGAGNPIPDGKLRKFYFGDVDYNAQRLARTMIAHAYQQGFEIVNEKDPFVTGYIWRASGQHGRTCQICLDRDGKLFDKDSLPLDHPNGMCTFEAYIPYTGTQIAERINRWYESKVGTYPEMDAYAETF